MFFKRFRKLITGVLAAGAGAAVIATFFTPTSAQAAVTPYVDTALVVDATHTGTYSNGSQMLPSSGDLTMEMWAKRDTDYTAGTEYWLWSLGASNVKGLYVKNDTFWYKHESDAGTDTGIAVPTRGWFHVAISITTGSPNTVRLFFNGSATAWSKTYASLTYGVGFGIGNNNGAGQRWSGQLDQYKIWNTALSATQVGESMNTFKAVGVSGSPTLYVLYGFNGEVNGSNTDKSYGTGPTLTPYSGSFTFVDVKTVDTTSTPGKTIYYFPRTYLNAEGGWQAPTGVLSNYEYLSVAGGGGGGGNRGGGGGAGGLRSGTVNLPQSAVFTVTVGAGGYSAANGGNTILKNSRATGTVISSTGGGAGGTHLGTQSGANGGSGGGASMCYSGTNYPTGGTGSQGYDGGSALSANCPFSSGVSEVRSTGGGGGSASAGIGGTGTTNNPTASTAGDTRPTGGNGTANSISGSSVTYAAGGGGALALSAAEVGTAATFKSAYWGAGGSNSLGGDGAGADAKGANAVAFTGSGGGGGGSTTTNAAYSGGFGSGGVLYLVATSTVSETVLAAGADVNLPVYQQPKFTFTGSNTLTSCSAADPDGVTTGVSVTCTAVSGTNSITLTDLTFTSGTFGNFYVVTFTFSSGDTVAQEIPIYKTAASITIASTGATTNLVWDRGVLMTTDGAAATVLSTAAQMQFANYALYFPASGAITQNSNLLIGGAGLGITFKGSTFLAANAVNITTSNGPVTIWATNSASSGSSTVVNAVKFTSLNTVTTGGGSIVIGGGNDPLNYPAVAENGLYWGSTVKFIAGGGNISVRADSVANASVTSNYQLNGIYISGGGEMSTTGSGTITLAANTDAPSSKPEYALNGAGTLKLSTVNGDINVTGGNKGSGTVTAIYLSGADFSTTGTGNITVTGDSRGTATTSTLAPSTESLYGIYMDVYCKLATVDGNITLTGRAVSHRAANSNSVVTNTMGLYINNSYVKSTGTGNISIAAYGGDIANAGNFDKTTGANIAGQISTNSGTNTVYALSGAVSGTIGQELGLVGAIGSTGSPDTYGGSVLSATGAISITGDTQASQASSANGYSYGFYSALGFKIKSTSGNISLTGTTCGLCAAGTDLAYSSRGIEWNSYTSSVADYIGISTGGAGTITIVGRNDNVNTLSTASSLQSYALKLIDSSNTRTFISTDTGAINITATGTAKDGGYAYVGSIQTLKITSNSGPVTISGITNCNSGGRGMYLYNSVVKTQTGTISIEGKSLPPGTPTSSVTGLQLDGATVTSGDSATSVTGGNISLNGQVPDFTSSTLTGMTLGGSTVDSFLGTLQINANQAGTTSNASRTGLNITGTNTIGATAASTTMNVYSGAVGNQFLNLASSSVLNLGGTSATGNFAINTDAINLATTTPYGYINLDTTGNLIYQPTSASFGPSTASMTTTAMVVNLVPTTRVGRVTIGKSGNTRAITLGKAMAMNTTTGHLVIFGGAVTASNQITANTLAVQSSDQVVINSATNDIKNVAVVRGVATNFNVVNSAASWAAGTFDGVTGVYGVPATFKASGTAPTTAIGLSPFSYSVDVTDAYSLPIASANTHTGEAVSVTVSKKTGATTTLGGTLTVAGTVGTPIAFTDLIFDAGGAHTLAFDATGYTQFVSGTITVTIKTAQATLSVTQSSGTYGATLTLTTTGGSGTGAVTYAVNSGTCTLNGAVLTLGIVGDSCYVTATKASDATYLQAVSASKSITVNKANQATVTVPSGTQLAYLDGTGIALGSLTYGGGSGTGTTYTFSTATTGCTITSNVLTADSTKTATSTCVVSVVRTGDNNYNDSTAASLTVTIIVADQAAISVTSTSGTFGNTLQTTYTGSSGTGAVTYVAAGTCTADASGLITFTSAGSGCTITVNRAATANKYNSATSGAVTITVAMGTQATVSITSSSSTPYLVDLAMTASGGSSSASGYVFATSTTGCSITGSTLSSTLGATNTCAVTAYKAADSNWNQSNTASQTVTIAKASQASLTVPSGTSIPYNGAGIDLATLTYGGGSGTGALSYVTVSSGCTITGTTLTSTGIAGSTCSVTVTKALDNNYLVGSGVAMTITVAKIDQPTLVVTTTTATYGTNLALAVTGGAGTGGNTWSVVSGTCTISFGNLTPTAAGSCVIRVTKALDTNYNAAVSADTTVTINKGNQATVAFTNTASVQYASTMTLTASGGSSTAAGYVFETSTSGCSISSSTLSNTLGAGNNCAVTVYKAGDSNWLQSNTASQTVSIVKATQMSAATVPSGVTIVYGSAGLDLSTLTYSGGEGTGAWTFSTATSGCSVTGNTLTSTNNAATTCSVSVVKSADANYNASTPQIMTVTITKADQAALTIANATITYLQTLNVSTLTISGGSSNGAITYSRWGGPCSLSGTTLSTTGAGTCVIQATMAGGTNYNNVTGSSTITISKANQAALTWSLGSTSVAYLGSLTLATTGGSGTGAVVYTVGSGSTCSVGGNVLMPGDAGSLCEVTATKVSDSNYNSIDTVTQTFTVTKIAQAAISFTNAAAVTYGQTLTVNAIGGSGDGAISYSISNAGTTGCTLSGAVLSVTASGTCTVAAIKATSANYLVGSQVTQAITVSVASQTVSFTSTVPASPKVSDTYNVSASSTSGIVVTFTVSGGCTISAGVVTFTGASNCVVTASAASSAQYSSAPNVTQTIAVGQQNQSITFSAASLAVTFKTFGDPSFAAEASSTISGLAPTFTRGAATTNNACAVNTAGVVTIIAVGTCEILADQAGNADTAAASQISKRFSVVADLPSAPAIVSVSAGHQSITTAFVKPSYTGGATVSGYEVVATSSGGSVSYNGCTIFAGNDQTCTISGLTNGTSYTIKVAAINSAGRGAYSINSAARVPATNPAAVSAFTAIPDNTTLALAWGDPVSLGGGTFDSYRIFIKKSSDASYPLTYITINSQATKTYLATGLINGEAYDAKIITVTTANTLELSSNTAEVRETPRTVPDAPSSLLIFEVNGNLIISWSAPVSDGGNAVSEYAAQVAGTTCVLANPTDTTCSVVTPTVAGTYPIEVKAKNAAGYSVAANITFTKAAVSGGGSGGSGGYVVLPAYPTMELVSVNMSKVKSSGGQVVTFVLKNLDQLNDVLVNRKPAKILKSENGVVQIEMPPGLKGVAVVVFRSNTGSLEVRDALTYVNGTVKLLLVTIKKYVQENSVLSAAAKASLKSTLLKAKNVTSVTCVGYQSWAYNRPLDRTTALNRAQIACNYLKSLNKQLTVKTAVARTSLIGPASRKLDVQFRTSN